MGDNGKRVVRQVLRRFLGLQEKPSIYMLDFHCFDHPESWMRTVPEIIAHGRAIGVPEHAIRKQEEIYAGDTLGVGPVSAYAPGIIRTPPDTSIAGCLEETRAVLSQCASRAMEAAGVSPQEVDFVLTTCTVFNPMPSMSAMIMHEFGMRSDCQNYSLSGQGCSAGVMLISLAKDLLTANPGKVALVVAHENITSSCYLGDELEFMAANVVFRSGGAAAVLSSRPRDRRRAKYQLLHTVRVNRAADTDAHTCIRGIDTDRGGYGVYLNTPVVKTAAASAIGANLRRLGPLVLPLSELIKAAKCKDPEFVPDFSTAFDHVCIHPGARFVIEKIRKTLQFGEKAAQPSHAALHRFGNTSGASTYYILAHLESRIGIKKGDKILQLGMGSGFKCCSAVWKALRPIDTKHPCWEFRACQPEPTPWRKEIAAKGENGELNLVEREASADLAVLTSPLKPEE
ncbi:g3728 [Coccomyxa elongata]